MKNKYLALSVLTVLFSALTLSFTGRPIAGYVKIIGQKSGAFKGSAGAPEWEIGITSYTYAAEDKDHHIQASVKFTKPIDEASNELQTSFTNNENLARVEFQLFNTDGKKQVVYQKNTLTNASIKQIDQNGPEETIRLEFQKINTQDQ